MPALNTGMYKSNAFGPIPRPIAALSDLVDFVISYNPADIVRRCHRYYSTWYIRYRVLAT